MGCIFICLFWSMHFSVAATPAPPLVRHSISLEEKKNLQAKVDELERELDNARQTESSLDVELAKLNKLLKLQAMEIQLNQTELQDMEAKLQETEHRKESLAQVVSVRKQKLREQLSQLPALGYVNPISKMVGNEKIMSTFHQGMIDKIIKYERDEIIALKKFQDELDELNEKMREEKDRIQAHVEDLKQKQSILSLNRTIDSKRLEKNRLLQAERLREFQSTKSSERQLEAMMNSISDINPPHVAKATVAIPTQKLERNFSGRKGELLLPVEGAVINGFGKKYDPKTSLYTFHKGIEIATKPGAKIRAIFPGKVAYSGKLGGYRQLLIIDHGKQFYSLAANLGETLKKVGESVQEGDVIGVSSLDNTPLYFEIRQRHIAVNPILWFKDLRLLAGNSTH